MAKFKRNMSMEVYQGTQERYEKVETIANEIAELILKSGLSYDEAMEVFTAAQDFVRQCKVTCSA